MSPNKFGIACNYNYVQNNGHLLSEIDSKENPIACGILYNKKKFIDCGMYNSNFKHREEEELRLRMGNKYDIYHLNVPLYRYRMHAHNKTKSKNYLIALFIGLNQSKKIKKKLINQIF